MINEELKALARKVKRLEDSQYFHEALYQNAKDYLDSKNGKADEFIPDDIFEDNLRASLKQSKRFVR